MARLLALVADLTRIESGRLELAPADMDLGALIARIVVGLQATTDRHRFVTRLAGNLTGVWYEHRRQEVLEHLLSNALKYSPAGGVIQVRAQSTRHELLVHFAAAPPHDLVPGNVLRRLDVARRQLTARKS
ncbi:MAG TPA: hypothetical protein VGL99_33980, partial [Chloroflexota bacterium]